MMNLLSNKKTILIYLTIPLLLIFVLLLIFIFIILTRDSFLNSSIIKDNKTQDVQIVTDYYDLSDEDIIALADRDIRKIQIERGYVFPNGYVNKQKVNENRRIEFISYNLQSTKPSKNKLFDVSYPYRSSVSSSLNIPLMNLVENFEARRWGFIDYTDYYHKMNYIGIHITPKNQLMISRKPPFSIEYTIIGEFELLTDINSKGTIILRNHDYAISIPDSKTVSVFELGNYKYIIDSIDEKKYSIMINDTKFINDELLLILCRSLYGDEKSYFIIYSLKDPNKSKDIVINEYPSITYYRSDRFRPLEISPCKQKAAYQSVLYDNNNNASYYLSICDFQTKETEHIVETGICNYYRYNPIKENIIAASYSGDHSFMSISGKSIKIIDINSKSIIKTIPDIFPKSMRWSPDGKKLGILSLKIRNSFQNDADSYQRYHEYIKIQSSSVFYMHSILDWSELMISLKNPLTEDKKRIVDFLDDESKRIIGAWEHGKELTKDDKSLLIKGLNELLKRRDFFDNKVFENITMCENAKEFLNIGLKNLFGKDLQNFNRLLVEAIFPQQIEKSNFYKSYMSYNPINESKPALWVYDLEKDTLEKIDEDEDFFDFFWVNRHDPKTKFFMKIEEAKYYIVTSVFIIILITILVIKKRKKCRRD